MTEAAPVGLPGDPGPVTGAASSGVPATPRPFDVLISYAPADVKDAEWAAAALAATGFTVYFDRERLASGESWEDAIIAALRDSASVVEIIGRGGFESLGRPDLPGLMIKAGRGDVPVLTVLLPSIPPGLAAPDWLSAHQVLDLRGFTEDTAGAEALLRDVVAQIQDGGAGASAGTPGQLADTVAGISGELTAADLAAVLLGTLPDGTKPVIESTGADRLPAGVWLQRSQQMLELKDEDLRLAPAAITLALALVEPGLWDALASAGLLSQLQAVLPAPVTGLLTPLGRRRYELLDRPPVAGYRPDDILGSDMLGVRTDVNALCDVIMAKDVSPPLSIGLFAEWGAGKSFFMGQMRRRIDELRDHAREAEDASRPAYWCTDVIQISFNAWHYIDTNLWASLAARVFEELDGGKSARRAVLVEQMGSLRRTEQLSRAAIDEAVTKRAAAESQLAALQTRKTSVTSELSEVSVPDLARSVATDPGLRTDVRNAASALGLPRDTGVAELGAAITELSTMGSRALKVWRLLGRSRHAWRRRVLIVGLLAAIGATAWFLSQPALGPAVAAICSVTVALGSAARTVAAVTKPGSDVLQQAENAYQAAETKAERAQLAEQQREEALRNNLHQLDAAIEERQAQLDQSAAQIADVMTALGPGDRDPARFYARILGGFASDDYRDRLGVVSAIQRDFEQLARLLPTGELPDLPKVQRIVLYIDDLDRCSAAQVVQVLQAVHLLLAFPLFVVIVGVDPRWLMRSLRVHHAALAAVDATTMETPIDELAGLATTPHAYLEKIFQIPFRLRPMPPEGAARLLADMLPVASDRGAGTAGPVGQAAAAVPAESAEPGSPAPAAAGPQEPPAATVELDPAPRSVLLQPQELRFLQKLAPLISTPRAVKRLGNVYRLVRATVPTSQLHEFTDDQYPAVMLLLAILVGLPPIAERLLTSLRGPVEPDDAPPSLDTLLDECLTGSDGSSASIAVRRAARLLPPGDPVPVMRAWAPQVSRFSFYTSA